MAFVPTTFRTAEENQQLLLGNAPSGSPFSIIPLAAEAQSFQGPAPAAPSASGTFQGSAQRTQPPIAPSPQMGISPGSTLQERLTSGISRDVAALRSGIGQARESFYGAAGPERTFESIGGPATLEAAIRPGGAFAPAQEILASPGYQGPLGFGDPETQKFQAGYETARARQRALGGGLGLSALVGEAAPGLSPGEARFEAQRLTRSPTFQAAIGPAAREVEGVFSEFSRERKAAEEFARRRQTGEQDIVRQARELLGSRQQEITRGIEERMAAAEAQRRAVEAAYSRFQETPDMRTLQATDPSLLGFQAASLRTPGQEQAERAGRIYQEIISRYPGFEQFGPLPVNITNRGEQVYIYPEGVTHPQAVELYKRQKEIEAAFNPAPYLGATTPTQGELAPFFEQLPGGQPLYGAREDQPFYGAFADPRFALPELQSFVRYDPGVAATRENVTGADMRETFNRINQLLGEANRLDAAGEPFKAASIGADAKGLLDAETAALEARKGELGRLGQEWLGMASDAHQNWRNARKYRWGKILGVAGDIALRQATGRVGKE